VIWVLLWLGCGYAGWRLSVRLLRRSYVESYREATGSENVRHRAAEKATKDGLAMALLLAFPLGPIFLLLALGNWTVSRHMESIPEYVGWKQDERIKELEAQLSEQRALLP
jgi:hypothetical protein